MMHRDARMQRLVVLALLATLAVTLAGCSLLFGSRGESEEPTAIPERAIVPTFTPTPEGYQAEPVDAARSRLKERRR